MKYLQIKKEDSIATVSINRPNVMNALSIEVLKEFCSLQEHFRKDLDTRVVIFTGEGDHFSAGADLKEKPQLSTKLESWRNNFGKPAIKSILDIDQITIAAVNGYCVGGAACIVSACDFRIASEKAFLVPAFGGIGLSGDYGGSWSLSQLVGPSKAKDIYFSNRRIQAHDALKEGIVNYVVGESDLESFALQKASEIAYFSPTALQYMKENHNRATSTNFKESLSMEADRMIRCFQTEDHKNAAKAFVEKKKPNFVGK